MSDLWRLRIRFIFVVVIGILIARVSAVEFGVSPPEINFKGDVGEEMCGEITLFSDRAGLNIVSYDKWNNGEGFRNLEYYNDSLKDGKIEYNPFLAVNYRGMEIICFTGYRSGDYEGVIIFGGERGGAGVGVWVSAKINEDRRDKFSPAFVLMGVSSVIYLCILLYLVSFGKR